MRAALIQLTVTDDPVANLAAVQGFIRQAVQGGAGFVLTPEMTNCLSSSRDHQRAIFRSEDQDETLAALRRTAQEHGIWLLIGSLGLLTQDGDGRFANRSFLIAPPRCNRASSPWNGRHRAPPYCIRSCCPTDWNCC